MTLAVSAFADSKYDLNLKTGDSFLMSSSVSQKITQNMMGMEMVIDLDVDVIMDLVVTELSKDDVLFTQSYKSLLVSMKSPAQGMEVNMDSDGESNQFNDAMKSIIGKKIMVRVDLEGNVLSVEGLEEILSDLETVQASGADVLQFFDKEGLEKNYQMLFPITYGKDYKSGSKWNIESDTDAEISVKLNNEYTATSVSKKVFEFSTDSSTSLSGDIEQQGMEMSINMEGSFNGSGELNVRTGLIKSYTQQGQMVGNTVIEANDQIPMDMDIPMTIEMVSIVSLK